MGSDISIFEEDEFAKEWEAAGLGNESMYGVARRSYAQVVETIVRPKRKRYQGTVA